MEAVSKATKCRGRATKTKMEVLMSVAEECVNEELVADEVEHKVEV